MSTKQQLHNAGLFEAVSYLLLLFICVPLKYLAQIPEPTRVVGMAHGLLFIAYCGYILFVGLKYDWSVKVIFLGLLASLIPFGPFWFEKNYLTKI